MSGFAASFGLAIDILLIACGLGGPTILRWTVWFVWFCWPLADLTGGHGQLNGPHESVRHYLFSFEGENKVSLNSALGLN